MNVIPAQIGDTIDEIDTPALIVDLDAFEHNVHKLASFARSAGVRLRPPAKRQAISRATSAMPRGCDSAACRPITALHSICRAWRNARMPFATRRAPYARPSIRWSGTASLARLSVAREPEPSRWKARAVS